MKKLLLSCVALAASAMFTAQADEVTYNLTTDASDFVGTYFEEVPAEGSNNGQGARYQPLESVKVGDFTITCDKGTGSTAPAYYYAMSTNANPKNTLRLYNGNSVTVTAPAGTFISKFAFTGNGSDASPIYDGAAVASFTYNVTSSIRFETITITTSNEGETPEPPTPVETKNYKLSTTVADGEYLIVALDGDAYKVATSTANKTYEYLPVVAMTATDGVIAAEEGYAYTFKAVEGGFTIQDPAGRYLYQTGTNNSFNYNAELPEDGFTWAVTIDSNGVATILNTSVNKYFQYSTGYNSFGSYAEMQEGAIMPQLFAEEAGSGIDTINVDNSNAPVEYFNLQGMRLNAPVAGQVVIRRQGTDVTKYIAR